MPRFVKSVFEVLNARDTALLGVFSFPGICMFRFGVNRVEYLPLEGVERHLEVKVAAPDGDQ
jgi:hypothetical protein